MSRNESTVYVGNISEKVTDDLLFELFLQAGPVVSVNIPADRGKNKPFGFVQFKHPCSVLYAIKLFDGISMYGKTLRLNLPKGAAVPGLPTLPFPMGLPAMPRLDLLPKPPNHMPIHGRLGPPVNTLRSFGHHGPNGDHDNSKDCRRSRRRDDMAPSSRSRKHHKEAEESPEFDMNDIPDLLDPLMSLGPPMTSHGPPRPSHGRRRDHPYDNKGGGHHFQHDSRRDRHSHHPSNKRRYF